MSWVIEMALTAFDDFDEIFLKDNSHVAYIFFY